MTPPLAMNRKMIIILVASIDASMKKEAMDSCLFLTMVTISGDIWTPRIEIEIQKN